MRPQFHNTFTIKLLLLGFFLLSILCVTLRSNLSSLQPPQTKPSNPSQETQQANPPPSCTKIPSSISNAILHYATSSTTPQQTLNEISVTARVLAEKSPCNFLIFGLGHDSLMWSALNHGGRTIFLDEDREWIKNITHNFPSLESYHVRYDTKVRQAEELLASGRLPECTAVGSGAGVSGCPLALKELPGVLYEVEWDLIMVDAPTGYHPDAPGRMGAIYTAGMAARGRREGETHVFVHDVNRDVEDRFSKALLCEGYMREQEGLLRHFTIPSHRANLSMPFCP